MFAKKSHSLKAAFDDSDLPVNNLTPERMEEIERLMMPRLKDALEKLRREKPHLFKLPKE